MTKEERNALLDAAQEEGRITEASRPTWDQKLQQAPEATLTEMLELAALDISAAIRGSFGATGPFEREAARHREEST